MLLILALTEFLTGFIKDFIGIKWGFRSQDSLDLKPKEFMDLANMEVFPNLEHLNSLEVNLACLKTKAPN